MATGMAWRGMLAGASLALLQLVLLGSGGLYSASGPGEIVRSLLWQTTMLALSGGAIGGLVGRLCPRRLRARAVRLLPACLLSAYGLAWAAVLARSAHEGEAPAWLAALALLLSLAPPVVALLRPVGGMATARPPRARTATLAVVLLLLLWLLPREAPIPRGPGIAAAPPPVALPGPPAQNLLLISFDTLRADHLGFDGYPRATSPRLDALAAQGTCFVNASCPRPKTSPSVATMLTGTWPARHGIHTPMVPLLPGNLTLAELLRDSGFRTGASVTNGNLYPRFGFDQGFTDYHWGHKDGATGAGLALAWLEENATQGGRWALWLHITDPHHPYEPDPPFDARFTAPGQSTPERMRALYDGEIAYSDHHAGRVIEWLDARPQLAARTLVVVTADHGESLGEHDYWWEHGLHPYEPSARVPLLFRWPGVVPAGARSEAVATGVDLLPTVLELLGRPVPAGVQGRSLVPALLRPGHPGPRQFAFLEAGYGPHTGPGRTRALRRPGSKYVQRLRAWALFPRRLADFAWAMDARVEGGLAPDEYYDLAADPGETRNLLHERREAVERDRAALRAFVGEMLSGARPPVDAGGSVLDARTLESLRSLGYIE